MSKRPDRVDVRLVSEIDRRTESAAPDEERPFIIGVLSDLTGRPICDKNGIPIPLPDRKPLEIDRDNFDAVMGRLDVRFEASLGEEHEGKELTVELLLRGMDSFHPDQIIEQVEPLRALLDLRRALDDPKKFDAAAIEVQKWIRPPETPPAIRQPNESSNLLDAILQEANVSPTSRPRKVPAGEIAQFVQEIVSPYLIRINLRHQQELIAAVEEALSHQIRSLLHNRQFKQLEAAWRSLYFLVANAETGPALKIYLLHVSKEELKADLAKGAIEDSGFFKNLSSFASEYGNSWGAFIANYDFTATPQDIELLDRIAQIAHGLRAPFIAGASPRFFGIDSFADLPPAKSIGRLFENGPYAAWKEFRKTPQAQLAGLLLPRFLLRIPYGAKSDPIDAFDFEEGVTGKDHDKYLWGNPAFAFAVILAHEFAENGWSLDPARLAGRLEGLPLHTYREGGISETKPCTEVLFTEELVAVLEREGFMPLVSYRDRDLLLVHCAQSVSSPPAFLSGRW